MDAFALGLLKADEIIRDGRLDAFVEERYSSFKSELGKRILSGKETLESLAAVGMKLKDEDIVVPSGRQEYLENLINSILFR